jgi:hypothetical protein
MNEQLHALADSLDNLSAMCDGRASSNARLGYNHMTSWNEGRASAYAAAAAAVRQLAAEMQTEAVTA